MPTHRAKLGLEVVHRHVVHDNSTLGKGEVGMDEIKREGIGQLACGIDIQRGQRSAVGGGGGCP